MYLLSPTYSLTLQARDVANIIYNLGKLKASDIPEDQLQHIIRYKRAWFLCIHLSLTLSIYYTRSVLSEIHTFTTQGFSNSIHGLARLGIEWVMLTPTNQSAILTTLNLHLTDLMKVVSNRTNSTDSNILKFEELLSILQSLAIMKVDWNKVLITSYSHVHAHTYFISYSLRIYHLNYDS